MQSCVVIFKFKSQGSRVSSFRRVSKCLKSGQLFSIEIDSFPFYPTTSSLHDALFFLFLLFILSIKASTTVGSANVLVSPRLSKSDVTIWGSNVICR